MSLAIECDAPPLRTDEHGVMRVGKSQVTLNTLIEAYQLGQTAEEIAINFPTVSLEQVYAIISYYLNHRSGVDVYLDKYRAEGEALMRDIEARPGYQEMRRRLLERARHRGLR